MVLFFIAGVSGAGKSHLAESLDESFTHIKGDDLTKHLTNSFFPKAKNPWNPHLIVKLLANNIEHFYSPVYILAEYFEEKKLLPPKGAKHIAIEGVILHSEFWRRKIEEAFVLGGLNFGDDIFGVFHNPPAAEILKQYSDRRATLRKESRELTLEDIVRQRSKLIEELRDSAPEFIETGSTKASLARILSLANP
jgi:RNase adaptor protein for sRNA GlmZ degradation